MKVLLVTVGKPRDVELDAIHDRYARRITRFGVDYRTASVPETRPGGRFSEEHALDREAAALLERLDGPGRVVALERSGRSLSSEGLSSRLEEWARPALRLVIGGPSGLGKRLLDRSDERWSLSTLTFPHELARVLVAEQVYRALTILRGIPYHR